MDAETRPTKVPPTREQQAMTFHFRSIIALSILVIVLAACGTAVGAPTSPSQAPSPSQPAAPTVEPSVDPTVDPTVEPTVEPSETPAPAPEERDVAGTITVYPGAFSGPGGTIAEALANGPTGDEIPTLVNGVLFRDTDGTVYLATAVSDVTVPTFESPMLKVLNTPNDGPSWDMANAELIGLEEANGIIFYQGAQILGTLEIN
jgi:hypothetical protein